jgi:hypothetical protein
LAGVSGQRGPGISPYDCEQAFKVSPALDATPCAKIAFEKLTIEELLADPDKPNPRCLKIAPGENPTFAKPPAHETTGVAESPDFLSEYNRH